MSKTASDAATIVLKEVRKWVKVFRTPIGEPFIRIKGADQRYAISSVWSVEFESWMRLLAAKALNKPPDAEVIKRVTAQLAAEARQSEAEQQVHTRIAATDEAIYVDLGQPNNLVVRITENGWGIIKDAPVAFRRTSNTGALPYPAEGGDIRLLRPFVNVASEEDFILFVALVVAALRGKGPYPHLVMFAEQGSAKTTTAELYKMLVDPVKRAVTLSPPRDARDLAISAQGNYILAFDNISSMPSWLSDCFCRLSTGAGFATRELYTNSGEVIFDAQRSVCLNGITEFAERGDLLDRAVVLNLPAIPEDRRMKAEDFWQAFRCVWPQVFGGLLTAVCMGLKNKGKVQLVRRPRMADFAEWVVGCEQALPWAPGEFMAAYEGNRGQAVQVALDASPIAQPLIAFVQRRKHWQGNASELLGEFSGGEGIIDYRSKYWPADGKALSAALDRIAPALRKAGVEVIKGQRTAGKRLITLKWMGMPPNEGDKVS
jgi:hypothetical protein